jgi:hypothetical protein
VKRYTIAGIEVTAQKSLGGSFYEVTVVPTGETLRYIAEVFETVAVPVKENQ